VYGEYTYRGVSAGLGTTCGFGGTQALCWGNNGSGQLGHGDKGDAWTPISVAPLDPLGFGVVAVNTRHACGVTADAGTAYCWGSDFAGQLGDGGHPSSQLPTPVAGGLAFSSVDVGMWFSCGVTQEGHAYCWGLSDKGQLGTAALTDVCGDVRYTEQPCSKEPVRAAEGLMVSALTTGSAHVCALTPDGVAYCWGDNAAGQLGDGTTTSSTRPVRVQSERRFVSIAGGDRHTCALTADGTAYCWGSNVHDQLGAVGAFDRCGGWSCSLTPSRVAGGLRFRSIAAARGPGGAHTCGVTESDLAYCWGSNDRGQLGTGFQGGTSPEPALVVGQPVSRDSGVAHAVFGTAANAHDRSCQTPE
jgi:alpha-tubulin suppressor-like RCC1 family protein